MNRKQFLTLMSGTVGATLLGRCASPWSTAQLADSAQADSVYASQGGLLELDLDARYGSVSVGEQRATLLSYSGRIPGPRLEMRGGDTVRIRFRNRLDAPTNLHYHGLHIPPTGNADNAFLKISPGERFTYEFQIPAKHRAMTAYYHPHLHGWVAQQVFGGLGGIMVVRGALDEIPEIAAAKESFLFLKDFDLEATANQNQPFHRVQMLGRAGPLVTVNGQANFPLSIAQGGLLRLRLVNASSARFYRLKLEEHPFYLIATDGGAIAAPLEVDELLLSPGERAEVLVQGNRQPGQYRLLNLPYNRGGMGMMGGPGMMSGPGMMGGRGMMGRSVQDATTPQTLATLTYAGQQEMLPLPQKLIPVEELPSPSIARRFTLNHGMTPGHGMAFLINGHAFDHQRVDTSVKLGAVEEWELVNTGMMDHPFHIHVNPFQIVSRNGQPEPHRVWKDTVLVRVGETVRIRTRFQDFAGKTVYHCHILDHEDLGMMGLLVIDA